MHGEYLALLLVSLGAVVVADRLAGLGVFRQARRLALALGPAVVVVLAWDVVGVDRWGWSSNRALLVGPYLLGGRLPLEEVLFPFIVGACALVVWEALGRVFAARGRRGR